VRIAKVFQASPTDDAGILEGAKYGRAEIRLYPGVGVKQENDIAGGLMSTQAKLGPASPGSRQDRSPGCGSDASSCITAAGVADDDLSDLGDRLQKLKSPWKLLLFVQGGYNDRNGPQHEQEVFGLAPPQAG
jgi:hypothetical protein